jgi:plastocyanin
MSRQHTSTSLASLVATLTVVAVLAPFAAGCSSKDAGAPAVTTTGPTFNFTFPANGVSHQLPFTDVGTWGYRCLTHGGAPYYMTGTVVVDGSSVVDSALVQVGGGTGFQFVPASVTIKPSGFVRWVNMTSATNHTVTRP